MIIYVAIDGSDINALSPLDDSWIYSEDDLSILKVPASALEQPVMLGESLEIKYVIAVEDYRYKIYYKQFKSGKNKFLFQTKVKACNPHLMFYVYDPLAKEMACGGDEQLLSVPGTETFDSC